MNKSINSQQNTNYVKVNILTFDGVVSNTFILYGAFQVHKDTLQVKNEI